MLQKDTAPIACCNALGREIGAYRVGSSIELQPSMTLSGVGTGRVYYRVGVGLAFGKASENAVETFDVTERVRHCELPLVI